MIPITASTRTSTLLIRASAGLVLLAVTGMWSHSKSLTSNGFSGNILDAITKLKYMEIFYAFEEFCILMTLSAFQLYRDMPLMWLRLGSTMHIAIRSRKSEARIIITSSICGEFVLLSAAAFFAYRWRIRKIYRGILSDGTKVTVKRLTDYNSPGGEAAFQREVQLISVAVHRNLLRLIGFVMTSSERILVYPYMKNLIVAYHAPGEKVLDWPTRKHIAFGVARGLEYLHEHCSPKIIHWDLKASNILLDDSFEAVLCDFGLAKSVDTKRTQVTTQERGTMGHIAPEYLQMGKTYEKTDVFGYGITLLELVTGQRAIDLSRVEDEEDILLLDHMKKVMRENRLDDGGQGSPFVRPTIREDDRAGHAAVH
ncbi:hypothetical protein MLD38_031508 [Melastoma candidum]|uniref:Uncharacterized protein n=1 Tax=Melastoma candidum TaxID=119954 RepID=A0ACB9MPW9_9MYRT|nr:hypothetical protein MLD38_031508 [Melastoma candidum]